MRIPINEANVVYPIGTLITPHTGVKSGYAVITEYDSETDIYSLIMFHQDGEVKHNKVSKDILENWKEAFRYRFFT